jgi:hypothetical protein
MIEYEVELKTGIARKTAITIKCDELHQNDKVLNFITRNKEGGSESELIVPIAELASVKRVR